MIGAYDRPSPVSGLHGRWRSTTLEVGLAAILALMAVLAPSFTILGCQMQPSCALYQHSLRGGTHRGLPDQECLRQRELAERESLDAGSRDGGL
jgi:hypothetical protein